MGRFLLLLLVIGLAVLAYRHFHGELSSASPTASSAKSEREPPSAPKQTIDNARRQAKAIEQDAQRRADEMLEKTK